LPTEAEWEYAASGGQMSKSYTFSGSDDVNSVAWYWRNSGDKFLTGSWLWATLEENNNKTKPVGSKNSNELNLYDMSGNVREWCEDWYVDIETTFGFYRSQRVAVDLRTCCVWSTATKQMARARSGFRAAACKPAQKTTEVPLVMRQKHTIRRCLKFYALTRFLSLNLFASKIMILRYKNINLILIRTLFF
jgi:formylglycine-generating enzyme required for sulfatase activity